MFNPVKQQSVTLPSGFTQLVFKIHGIKLRRDACQQTEQGIEVPSVSLAQGGRSGIFRKA
jgi:hypothetical protein